MLQGWYLKRFTMPKNGLHGFVIFDAASPVARDNDAGTEAGIVGLTNHYA